MKKVLFIVFALLIGFAETQAMVPFRKKTGIREIILVKFKNDVSPAQRAELDKLIRDLKSNTKTIEKVEWGKRIEYTDASKAYDQCLMLKFKNDNDLQIFQSNPVRLKLMGKLIPISDKILKFTYKIE
ncbi:hypothetical protein MNBD_BACTEROID07-754 [hydrothermal vent metagenome]|uniref:Stress-response A/B barrel domain-containing protein n=1 Tax=hydrothermal vent metagenome TaxID=652676 RepID=A0A3B0UBP7_9ZZZZ